LFVDCSYDLNGNRSGQSIGADNRLLGDGAYSYLRRRRQPRPSFFDTFATSRNLAIHRQISRRFSPQTAISPWEGQHHARLLRIAGAQNLEP
jgi:hypothetical protein